MLPLLTSVCVCHMSSEISYEHTHDNTFHLSCNADEEEKED